MLTCIWKGKLFLKRSETAISAWQKLWILFGRATSTDKSSQMCSAIRVPLLEQKESGSDSTWQLSWNPTLKKPHLPQFVEEALTKIPMTKPPGKTDRGTWSFPVSKLPDLQGNPRGRKAVVDYSAIDKAFSVPRLIWKLGLFSKGCFSLFFSELR